MTALPRSEADRFQRPLSGRWRRYRILALIPLVLLALGTVLASSASGYWISTFTSAGAIALACAGVAVLYGQLGLVSLCQYALLGVGGWVALRLAHGLHWPFEICLLAGGIVSSAVGVVWGLPALRLRGLYLALVTLMLAGAFQVVIAAWGFPDGGPGFLGRADSAQRRMMARPLLAVSDAGYLLYVIIVLALGLMLVELHRRSKPGRAWALIRKGETTALGAGVNILLYKTWAFALAGFLAGIGGGLLAGSVGQLDGLAFAASESINLFALTVVGGAAHWFGPIISGLLLRAVPSLLTDYGVDGFLAMVFFGAALLHALITAPAGVAGMLSELAGKLVRRKT